ncbi:MAG: hypothetical protein [Microviridae sp.]|nr:MAG: hypothetical protein [Microviridae sp.]
MKQTDKEKSKTPTEAKTLKLQSSENQTDSAPSGEELIQRQEVEGTPFTMITINKKTFGTFGKYRITEEYHTKQQCEVELKTVNWNRLVQIMTLVNEMLNTNTARKI